MGCGTGQLSGELDGQPELRNIDYVGVDQSAHMIAEAQRKYPHARFGITNVSDYQSNKNHFDVIVCSHAFPYFVNKAEALEKFHTMLKPNGILLLAQASTNNFYDRIALSLVKLTTSAATYLSIQDVCALAAPMFPEPLNIIRIGRSKLMPSIYLFKWTKR